jgi:epoxyqueuosine reductase
MSSSTKNDVKDTTTPPTAASLYQVRPDYQRFNQKFDMTRQHFWNPKWIEFEKRIVEKRGALRDAGPHGYEQIDFAFARGASINEHNSGFPGNYPNQRGNSWKPLRHGKPSKTAELTPESASRAVTRVARLAGADIVGFCRLDRRWVYSHYFDEKTKQDYPIRFSDEPGFEAYTEPTQLENGTQVIPAAMKYVVVMIFEMDELGIAAAPTMTAMATVNITYSHIGFTALALAEFIRGLGYNAIPSANCTALSVPLAIDAGLGQLGRHGKLITPRFGPRCRIAKVITDLPLVTAPPVNLGVTEFCETCLKCARECPGGAIPSGPRSYDPVNECNSAGVLRWQLDHQKCRTYRAQVGTNCGICLRVCPFNKGKSPVHGVTRWAIRHVKPLNPAIAKLDDLMGYGRFVSPRKFWE